MCNIIEDEQLQDEGSPAQGGLDARAAGESLGLLPALSVADGEWPAHGSRSIEKKNGPFVGIAADLPPRSIEPTRWLEVQRLGQTEIRRTGLSRLSIPRQTSLGGGVPDHLGLCAPNVAVNRCPESEAFRDRHLAVHEPVPSP